MSHQRDLGIYLVVTCVCYCAVARNVMKQSASLFRYASFVHSRDESLIRNSHSRVPWEYVGIEITKRISWEWEWLGGNGRE